MTNYIEFCKLGLNEFWAILTEIFITSIFYLLETDVANSSYNLFLCAFMPSNTESFFIGNLESRDI